ncbi:DUF6746 family protein [Marinobacter salicampi]|uniref:DUF6746 family protein n=1 Tax=Marinobacter salicampi TaxID=435907 RepID=UPI001F5F1645|nr:DUF6746 family protein [Marinobacter salicampi]
MNRFMPLALICSLGVSTLALSPLTFAEERPDHFEGKKATTLEQAVANFMEYNEKLANITGKESLSDQNMHEVHQMTYTLENALEKIRNELGGLADVLEEVHIASESNDPATVTASGATYLETAGKVIKQ